MTQLPAAHVVAPYFLNPTNPITVALIGAGGTGSQVLTQLARINHAMLELEHPGLDVTLWDADVVSPSNLGRQLFAQAELGYNKSYCLINRTNRFFGTNWKAVPHHFTHENLEKSAIASANLFITCVDSVEARFDIANLIRSIAQQNKESVYKPYYWMDFGNSQFTGQAILSTIGTLPQPDSAKYHLNGNLPFITEEFGAILRESETTDNTPSCSLAEALQKQDLFINSTLANMGCSVLWKLFREGIIQYRGVFLNLADFQSRPLMVSEPRQVN